MKLSKLYILFLVVAMCLPTFVSCRKSQAQDPSPGTFPENEWETDSETETESHKGESSKTTAKEIKNMQIIPRLDFAGGIQLISQKDHANGDRFSVLDTHDFYGGTASNPVWRLAQWDSGPSLVENRVASAPAAITDGIGRRFAFDPAEKKMTFELDTALYYQGRAAVSGDYWPHLLVEQENFLHGNNHEIKKYLNCGADCMMLSFDIRLTEFEATPIDGDWVRAAQFLMYFYVKGVQTNDFCWLGLQLFDNRRDQTEHYIGYDNGNPSTSGAMIYSIGSKHVYGNSGRTLYNEGAPDTGGEWVHVEIDLRPYLEEMLEIGARDGYFKVDSLSDLCINGMNIGWETIATFDHTMEVKNLELVSHLE